MDQQDEAVIAGDILQLEKARCEALVACDVEALGALMADDLVHIHGNGHIDDKAAYLQGVTAKFKFHRVERGELNVRIYGDIAIVVGPLDQTVTLIAAGKTNVMKAMTVQTWVREDGQWKQNTCQNQFLSVTPAE